jgi:cellulose synthase/poly-beta-1,6-N-acetylglucosamine synthase-like glycosyltransferase
MLVLTAVCLVLALVQLALAWRARQTVPPFDALDAPGVRTMKTWPRLSVVVPARDEAHGIEAALASKLACGYPNLEIVLVDDRSTDGTGTIARRLAAQDDRLTIVRVDELPAGWLGKVHAMSVGIERACGDWILLSDADVHIERGTLERAVAYAEAHEVDLVAMMPRVDLDSALLDACMASMLRVLALGGRVWQANDDRSDIAVGVGAFNLVRKSALAKSPGLAHLKMEMADDVALGAMLKACGARCRFVAARGAVHLVVAERLGVLARGMEKGGGLFGFSLARTLLVAALWFAIDFGVPLAAMGMNGLFSLAGAIAGCQLFALTLVHGMFAQQFGGRTVSWGVLLWPIGGLLGLAMIVRSGALAWWREAIVWRGTYYTKSELEAGRRWIHGRVHVREVERPRSRDQRPDEVAVR